MKKEKKWDYKILSLIKTNKDHFLVLVKTSSVSWTCGFWEKRQEKSELIIHWSKFLITYTQAFESELDFYFTPNNCNGCCNTKKPVAPSPQHFFTGFVTLAEYRQIFPWRVQSLKKPVSCSVTFLHTACNTKWTESIKERGPQQTKALIHCYSLSNIAQKQRRRQEQKV